MDQDPQLTEEQIRAIFAKAAKGVVPADMKPKPLTERLAPYLPVLVEYRALGFSSEQQIAFLHEANPNLPVSASFLRKYLATEGHRHKRRSAKQAAVVTPNSTAATPVRTPPRA